MMGNKIHKKVERINELTSIKSTIAPPDEKFAIKFTGYLNFEGNNKNLQEICIQTSELGKGFIGYNFFLGYEKSVFKF